ncbi:MAG TPA: protein kinase [Terriglobales bacterium]
MATNVPPRIGKYDIVELIGRGGMGIVYKGNDTRIGRLVAIKVMTGGIGDDPELRQRFYHEAQSAGKLQHPNIVTVYELGELDATPYLVMEFIEGEALDHIIHAHRDLPLEEKLDLVVQICNGLHYAHKQSIVHRDIKPGNIMVTTNGTVKIVDFGLAHIGADHMTRPGQVMGSINYMSPEQINGQPVDFRTDVFATGVVLYQLLTYALPFQGADTGSTLLKIIHEPPLPLQTFLKEYPPELENVIQRALAKDREARFASAEDFAVDLGQILDELKRKKIEQRLQTVQELMARSELDEAQEQLNQVLKLDRQHRRGNELMREVRRRIQKRVAQQQAQELRRKAEEAVGRQNFDEALLNLKEAVKLDDSNPELIQLRDSVQETKARGERIRQALQRAESAQASGELQESLKAIEEVLALDSTHAEARAMHAAVSDAIRVRERRKQFQELSERARKQIAAREFQQALDTLKKAEQIDAAAAVLKELTRAAATGLEQERCRREIERLAAEIEDALNHDDYRAALAKAEEGLRQFAEDRRLQQLKTMAVKQRQAGERRAYIAEQIATARRLLESGKTAEALAIVEAASGKYPAEAALLSMRAMVKETLAREELEREAAECTQKAKDLLRGRQYSEAIQLLESARDRLQTTDFDDLIQFARDEAAMYARRQKLAAITEQANGLISAEEYERAIELLQTALAESPGEELQGLLADAQRRLAEFTRSVAEAVAAAQRLISRKRVHEAVRLLESQPRSFIKSADFTTTLDKAREEVKRIQAVSVAREQAREALANEDLEKAAAIAQACRNEVGDMIDLALLDNEIKVRRTEVFTRRVESAVTDARTLLIGRSYRSALDILDTVSEYVEEVSAELRAQYNLLRSQASRGTGRRQSEAELRQPAVPPGKDHGPGSGVTMPQTHWTLAGAATPAMPPEVAPPPPGVVDTREVNIIGQGDSSSVHDRGLEELIPLGPPEVTEATLPPPQPAQSPTVEVPETICVQETQIGELDPTLVEAQKLPPTQLVSALHPAPDVAEGSPADEKQLFDSAVSEFLEARRVEGFSAPRGVISPRIITVFQEVKP